MGIARLLATTDFSNRAERALKRAALLAHEHSSAMHILHVVDNDQPQQIVEEEEQQSRLILKKDAAMVRGLAHSEPTLIVRVGDPSLEIVRTATDHNYDLIVMGVPRKNVLREIFVGTTIERVLRAGHRSVLMANVEPSNPYGRVVVATDMSPFSANALRTAKELGLLDRTYVSLIHAFQPLAEGMMIYANVERERVEEYAAQEALNAKRRLIQFVNDLGLAELKYDVWLEEGSAYDSIVKFVDKHQPNLLVVGIRGLSGAKRILLGSVADAVLRTVSCDVLAVPPTPT